MTITSTAATDTGSLTMRSSRNAARAIPAVATARMSRDGRAPVLDRTRKCATVQWREIEIEIGECGDRYRRCRTGRATSTTVPEVGWLVVWEHGKLVARRAARATP